MKTGCSYALLVNNTNERRLWQEYTFLNSKYKKTKYALIVRTVNKDNSEICSHINYSNDLQKLSEQMKKFVSYYDYVNGYKKNIQGYISEV